MFAMKQTVGILLTPVMDQHGVWTGIWVRHGADCSEALADFCPALNEETAGLRIFVDGAEPLPAACLYALPPEKTWLVAAAANTARSQA